MFGNNKRVTKVKTESFYDVDEDIGVDDLEQEEEEEEYVQDHHVQSQAPTASHDHPAISNTRGKKTWFHIPNLLSGHKKEDDDDSVDSMAESPKHGVPVSEEEQEMILLAEEASEAEFHRKQQQAQMREEAELRRAMEQSAIDEQNRQHHIHHPTAAHAVPHSAGQPQGAYNISPYEAEQLRYIQQIEQRQQCQGGVSPSHAQTPSHHHGPPPHQDAHNGPFYGITHSFPPQADSSNNAGARDDPAGLQAAMTLLMLAQRHFEHDPTLTSLEAQRHAWELSGQWLAQASAQLQLADRSNSSSRGHHHHHHAVPAPSHARHQYGAYPPQQGHHYHHQGQQQQQVPQFEDKPWECPACTLMNQAKFLTCEACGTPCR